MFYCSTKNEHLLVSPSGYIVSPSFLYLGASADVAVYNPSNHEQPFGFVKMKCPYLAREITLYEAAQSSGFCCAVDSTGDITLKENHAYYSQEQGQMANGEWPWCDAHTKTYTHTKNLLQQLVLGKYSPSL